MTISDDLCKYEFNYRVTTLKIFTDLYEIENGVESYIREIYKF